ncbi:glycosyltransferase [Candidatus Gottesmanbacteria bacterium]|nr:glycosyltransferase [Candidatus Gottesmanbacteria bacterium]
MKISVVIPAYNEEKYIAKTLESVKNADRDDNPVEILVIDGGSGDKTAEIAKKFGAKVVVIPHRGIGFARQKGIENASGEIIIYTDADSIVPYDWMKVHVDALLKSDVVLSYGPFKVKDGSFAYKLFINYLQYYGWFITHYIFNTILSVGQNTAFWREKALFVGGYDTKLGIMEDIDFSQRLSKQGKAIYHPNLIVYASGRRSKEGWRFFTRTALISIKYFLFGDKNLGGFPDFR